MVKIRVSKNGIVRKGHGKREPRHENSLTRLACEHARKTGERVDTTDYNRTARDRRTDAVLERLTLERDIKIDE